MTDASLSFNPDSPFILVDGSSYLFRAFHAMPPLTNSEGHPTGAIYGVINMIGKLIEQYQPERIAVVFDAKGKNFRHEMFADYKAHRPPMPEDLAVQIDPIHQLIKALGIPLLMVEGVEADDVMGTLAHQATEVKMDALLSTGDKDMAQLVNDHITLINTMNDTLMTPETVPEKFHVKPSQIIDYLALVGDTSDNIPGIPKCGPKTAAKWLAKYDTVDNLIEHADEIGGKIGETLRANIDQLKLSQKLTTIRTDCDLPIALADIKRQTPDMEQLQHLLQQFELRSWLNKVLKGELPFSGQKIGGQKIDGKKTSEQTPRTAPASNNETDDIAFESAPYETILDNKTYQAWLKRLKDAGRFAIDTETTSLRAMQAEIVGLSFAWAEQTDSGPYQIHAAYLPLAHDYDGAPEQLDRAQALAEIQPLLEDPTLPKIGQNLKYDWHVFKNAGITLAGIDFDTMLESYCYNSTATRHNMDDLAQHYLQKATVHFEDIAGKGKKQKTFNQIEIEPAAAYAAEDADITLQLHLTLWEKLQADPALKAVFTDIEMPLLPVLANMEHTGVLIDRQMLADHSYELDQKLTRLKQAAHDCAGVEFNLNSSKQLQEVLFERMGIPVVKKTPKGQPSTAEPVLVQLAEDGYELPDMILQYRSMAKLKSTYTDALPKQIHPKTGRVHTSYQQAVASTGRLSSTEPNLQNIPIRNAEGRRIRQAFIARDGYQLIAADYSQIELRIMAHLSGDQGLLKAFSEGKDIHQATAAEIFNTPLDQVTAEQRRSAKAVNFGLIYGMSAFGLAKQLQVPRNVAQDYINLYFARYPGVADYMERTKQLAKEKGYVETLKGRRLYLPEINARNGQLRQYAERTAINAPMQGTAADIIKTAMIQLQPWLDQTDHDITMLMQVHDELIFEVAEKDLEAVQPKIRDTMESALKLDVPLIVDIGQGKNWDEAH
ncbi:DNA polymerase I [Thiomicrospira sp. WB1]|uniref:DNA polymerase I n=1 Tax=Thiomicrospira sp. WB1 TaxID=1685380 RepID=UPI000746019A|nr:DNA polymerase I [Thiomicrospira sp. WB1]KUJ72298.1 DNA polymerase I [Thiomicrospira sp. WB1]